MGHTNRNSNSSRRHGGARRRRPQFVFERLMPAALVAVTALAFIPFMVTSANADNIYPLPG